MPTLTIKNVSEDLYLSLKDQAKEHHRSLNSEVIASLEQVTRHHRLDVANILHEARQLRKKSSRFLLTQQVLNKAKNQGRV